MKRLKLIYKNELEVKSISLFKAFIIMLLVTVIPVISNFLSTLIMFLIDEDMSIGTVMIGGSIVITLSNILSVIVIAKLFTYRDDLKDLERLKNNKINITKNDLLYVFLVILGYILIREGLLFDILSKFEGPISDEDFNFIFENSTEIETIKYMLIMELQSIVEAPIFEELLFRGIILSGLLVKYKGNYKKAIVYSALIFAVIHMNIPQGINAFLGGIILGSIYYYTNSIKLSMFAHFINNLIVFIPVPSSLIIKIAYVILGLYMMITGIKYIKENIYDKLQLSEDCLGRNI